MLSSRGLSGALQELKSVQDQIEHLKKAREEAAKQVLEAKAAVEKVSQSKTNAESR